ncbi:MAG: 5-formyltetrahydrofolate cyclo-ligase [Pseudomonadota bacterium]|nr:5-formyltetrahydrofolate cyclo-ligase [Pseudomonadota bacterium]
MTATAEKARLRTETLARRDSLDPSIRAEMSLAACAHAEPHLACAAGTVISGFLPIRSEIDISSLMQRLHARGAIVCLPAVLDRQTIAFREFVPGGALEATGFGTSGPGRDARVLDPAILLMPLAAFDPAGNRIGYGAGHYDRAIARLLEKGVQPRLVGFAFSLQEVEHVPALAHDRPLDAIVTEKGYREFSTNGQG